MKHPFTTLTLIALLFSGCNNDDDRVSDFIIHNGTPIIVKKTKSAECKDCGVNYTLISMRNGNVLLIKNSQLTLPDTLK